MNRRYPTNRAAFAESFKSPSSQYRGAPFWAWNGKLDPQELRRQIRLMHRMGLGGFFMHSRVGLDTPYLSDEWFDCVSACIDEAEKLDMQAWLYDEDRWPSGAAGGLVTKDHRYRARHLVVQELSRPGMLKWSPEVVAVFTVRRDGDSVSECTRLKRGKRPGRLGANQSIQVFSIEVAAGSDWYNGQAYLDIMNHDAVREFIRVTHEEYLARVGKHFGKRIPGIFTDEPHALGILRKDRVAWTGQLPQTFKKRYGYDVLDHLPELFFPMKGQQLSRTRYHFTDCSTHMLTDAFARQIGDWCEKNHLPHTGHVLSEETLSSQSGVVGSAMRFYQHMQIPGMDLLTEHNREYDTAKQVASVARQFGRKWRLNEIYGCTGWDFPFMGHKALGDWQAALGINIRCQHLSWYTMEGQTKRDFPASIFYQSSWFDAYTKVENYFARVNLVLSQGEEIRDILVIHPVESLWTINASGPMASPESRRMSSGLIALRDSLLKENLDFDYGDESIIAERGSCVTRQGAPTFKVGKATYKAIIVPQQLTIRGTTLELLRRFRKSGGTVIFAGVPPKHVDAVPSRAAEELAGMCQTAPAKGKALAKAVEQVGRRVSICDDRERQIPSALYQLREDSRATYFFICNTGHKATQLKPQIHDSTMVRDRRESFPEVTVSIAAPGYNGEPRELNPDSGTIHGVAAERTPEGWRIKTALPALGSRIFMIPKQRRKAPAPAPDYHPVSRRELRRASWNYSLSEDNVLVLDRPKVKIGKGKLFQSDDAVNADILIRDAMGIKRRGGRMVQPWARTYNAELKRTAVALKYSFEIKALPSGPLYLGIERPETLSLQLNGQPLAADDQCGWWCDHSLRKLPVDPSLLKIGSNLLCMNIDYDETHPGLEIVYLLGHFGVKLKGAVATMTSLPTKLKLGDWVPQALPFYSGSVVYHTELETHLKQGERTFLQVPEYRGTALRVRVNDQDAGVIAWEPNELDITDLLTEGRNRIAIELFSHRRNSHGPLHLIDKWPSWTGPDQFLKGDGKGWSDDYQLVPCGIMQPPVISIRR